MNVNFIKRNRERLLQLLEDDSIVVLVSNKLINRSADSTYAHYPNRSFYYFTGITQEQSYLIIGQKGNTAFEYLFTLPQDPLMETWNGKRLTAQQASSISGIDKVIPETSLLNFLSSLVSTQNIKNIYMEFNPNFKEESQEKSLLSKILTICPYLNVLNCYSQIASLRAIKQDWEIQEIKHAIEITKSGIETIMSNAKEGYQEYLLSADFDYTLAKCGCRKTGFDTIIATGSNALCLHYTTLNDTLKNDDMLLLDLGATSNLYSADISRTFPVSGKFNDRQKAVYEAVLRVQEQLINNLAPGIKVQEIEYTCQELLKKEIADLGLTGTLRDYYLHSFGHQLGLDVHDGYRTADLVLEPGMVFTVEPGLYIKEWDIGVRIEDNILITADGHENLSSCIIKSVDEIERFMASVKK